MDASNAWAVIGGATVTGIFTWAVMRSSKVFDARSAAEAALWAATAPIISEQNRRIAEMQTEIDRLWKNVRDTHDKEQECRDELRNLRNENHDLQTKMVGLEHKFGKLEDKE